MAENGANPNGPPDIGGLISIKVDNFPFETTKEELTTLFSEYGDVKDCYLPKEHATGRSRGFGFIRYASEEEVERAVKACDNMEMAGRNLRVQVAQHSRPPLPPRNAGGGYGKGDSGYGKGDGGYGKGGGGGGGGGKGGESRSCPAKGGGSKHVMPTSVGTAEPLGFVKRRLSCAVASTAGVVGVPPSEAPHAPAFAARSSSSVRACSAPSEK